MFSHSSHFKKLIALCTITALFVMTLAPFARVLAEGEGQPSQEETPLVVDESPAPESPAPEQVEEEEVVTPDTTPDVTEEQTDEQVEEESMTPTATSTEEAVIETEEVASSTEPLTIVASSTQTIVVDTEATSTSDTGNNTASSTATSTETSVQTGDAVATANVVTAVNVSSYNSSGLILFLTNLLGGVGTIDFRNLGFMAPPAQTGNSSSSCSFVGCDSGLFTNISTEQNADVTNTVSVGANTGGNTASGGNASVSTGNATAAANVVTVANSTFIDSNYVMVVFNQFGSWGNDIVLPGANAFGGLFGSSQPGSGSISATTNNTADVDTTISVTADTGNNTASSTDGAATIETGDAHAGATVVNTVNTSLIDSNAFVIIFRVHGSWSGSLFGLPQGVSWEETPDGIALYSSPDGGSSGGGSLTSSTTQNATIHNNIDVYALTGQNKAEGESSHISTGEATAAVNVVNIANSQVIGRNWLFAIVNIFGDWSGNIAFGRPDLWVAGSVDMPQNPARERDTLHYSFTLQNNGDADAHNTTLIVNLPDSLEYRSADSGAEYATGTVTWQLGTFSPHATKIVTLDAAVTGHIDYGTSQSSITPQIHADEPDQNEQDNQDLINVDVFRPGPAPVSYTPAPHSVTSTPIPAINITKVVEVPSTQASSTVTYHISLTNEAEGPAYDTILFDTLRDPQGNIVFEKTWDIGNIAPHETVNVDYDVFFVGSSTPGIYVNEAYLKGLGGLPWSEPYNGFYVTSRTATTTVTVLAAAPVSVDSTSHTRTATSTVSAATRGKSLLYGPQSINTPLTPSYGQIAALGFAADSRSILALFPLFLALLAAAHYLSHNGTFDIGERRELILDFLRSHHLFFW